MTKKYLSLAATAVLLAVIGIGISWLSVVFGWTNPTQSPPQGSGLLTVLNGNVGVNTNNPTSQLSVNGAIDAMSNLIHGVATPIAGTDAANKDYVDAQISSSGGATFTMFNIATAASGNYPGGGSGVPACPSDYGEVVAGYGPLSIVFGGGWNAASQSFNDRDEPPNAPFDQQQAAETVAVSYSVCSNSPYHVVPSAIPTPATGLFYGYVIAKACADGVVGGVSQRICNTCRVCAKGLQAGELGPYGSVPLDTR